jgi:hypothetical protein
MDSNRRTLLKASASAVGGLLAGTQNAALAQAQLSICRRNPAARSARSLSTRRRWWR